jgi:hypothetical protein
VTDGVLLGEVVDKMFIVHTFITYEMATGLQREEFEKNRELILTNEEILDIYNKERKEEFQRMREDIITEAMRMKNSKLI